MTQRFGREYLEYKKGKPKLIPGPWSLIGTPQVPGSPGPLGREGFVVLDSDKTVELM